VRRRTSVLERGAEPKKKLLQGSASLEMRVNRDLALKLNPTWHIRFDETCHKMGFCDRAMLLFPFV
jgi:hypothetical protein